MSDAKKSYNSMFTRQTGQFQSIQSSTFRQGDDHPVSVVNNLKVVHKRLHNAQTAASKILAARRHCKVGRIETGAGIGYFDTKGVQIRITPTADLNESALFQRAIEYCIADGLTGSDFKIEHGIT